MTRDRIIRDEVDPCLWPALVDLVEFDATWRSWWYTDDDGVEQPPPRPDDWPHSVLRFLGAGLAMADLFALVDVTMAAEQLPLDARWRYFCGCAWNLIRRPGPARQPGAPADNHGGPFYYDGLR